VLLREGRVVADGPKDEVLSPARLTELFGVPVQMSRRDGYYHLH
jgi:iron complex transport system ATP-binding protein